MPARLPKADSFVLDAWALLAWLSGEPAAARVDQVFNLAEQQSRPLNLSVVNAGEVYYRYAKTAGPEHAERFLGDLRSGRMPVRLAAATNPRIWRAARLKAGYAIAYADAFAASLARELDLPVLTGDPDFKVLERAGECRVEWLPKVR